MKQNLNEATGYRILRREGESLEAFLRSNIGTAKKNIRNIYQIFFSSIAIKWKKCYSYSRLQTVSRNIFYKNSVPQKGKEEG